MKWTGYVEVPFEVEAETEEDARQRVYHDLAFGHLSVAEAYVADIEPIRPPAETNPVPIQWDGSKWVNAE